jgi:hypothetical protein
MNKNIPSDDYQFGMGYLHFKLHTQPFWVTSKSGQHTSVNCDATAGGIG